ncbi:hypothetical protein CG709_13175 [Lachnotalea glycerini]|nr:hypothetical protein CG709_13175 [Lachnotalea glycerini]
MLRFLIYNLEKEDTEDYYLLAYLENEGITDKFIKMKELAGMDINNVIINSMNFWQNIMNNMIKEIRDNLKDGLINDTYDNRLQDSINNWNRNINKWSLINDADNYN